MEVTPTDLRLMLGDAHAEIYVLRMQVAQNESLRALVADLEQQLDAVRQDTIPPGWRLVKA